jgi:pyruvate kinase
VKRTKIVCTVGPASRAPETLEGLVRAGGAAGDHGDRGSRASPANRFLIFRFDPKQAHEVSSACSVKR